MFRWAFLFLVAGILVWMFSDSKSTRVIGLSVLGAIAAILAIFFYFLDNPDRREAVQPVPDPSVAEVKELTRKQETSQLALKPSDVALLRRSLTPGKKTTVDGQGKQYQTPDLFSWTVSGDIKNLSEKNSVKDVYLRVSLFDCPVYFDTTQQEITFQSLKSACSVIGERSVGLYDLKIVPGSSKKFSETVQFNDQIEPRNWRSWINVDRVSAVAE